MADDPFARWNSYFYPGTDVLINKFGIKDATALEAMEYAHTMGRMGEMLERGLAGPCDLSHLKSIHAELFGDVYEWAGQIRDVGLAKNKSTFALPADIPAKAEALHQKLVEANYFGGKTKQDFIEGLAPYYAELNELHPFREGNGRSSRVLLSAIAEKAGYALDQPRIDAQKGRWNSASIAAEHGDMRGLVEIFNEAIRPMRSVAFEQQTREDALAKHPELSSHFAALDKRAAELKAEYPGNEKAQAHFLGFKKSEIIRQLDGAGAPMLQQSKTKERSIPERFAENWRKAVTYADEKIKDPKARETFLDGIEKRIQDVHRAQQPKAQAQGRDR